MPEAAERAYQPSSTLEINFSDGMTAEQRHVAEESVATLISRSCEARAQQRAEQAYEAELAAAIYKPLVKIIESDPAAATALAADHKRRVARGIARAHRGFIVAATLGGLFAVAAAAAAATGGGPADATDLSLAAGARR